MILRDSNFVRQFQNGIRLSKPMYASIVEVIQKDATYLSDVVKTTDYSLLIGYRELKAEEREVQPSIALESQHEM